jgi:cytochrome d ubiquinol oxidase subunit II
MPAANRAADSLTIAGASSQHNTLVVMTIVAACFVPFVLAYQAWTYWVFRQRLVRPPEVAGSPPAPFAGPGSRPHGAGNGAATPLGGEAPRPPLPAGG